MTLDDPILETWSSVTDTDQVFPIMPDGCRDLIIKQAPGNPQHLFISSLMSSPKKVFAQEGTTFIGVRLKPGATICPQVLESHPLPDSMDALTQLTYNAASLSSSVSDMMHCLAFAASPSEAANNLGVSLRTLQRHTLKTTGRNPGFWRRLARARKAVRCILSGSKLHEAAHECNFSDQAHMTRELKNWFAMTPGELASSRIDSHHPAWSICDSGYDAPWTGEHISTR